MPNTTYITKHNDRWDLIAFEAYGDATLISGIIQANPKMKIFDVLPAGLEINIPIVDPPQVQENLLPLWKRGAST